MGIPWLRHHNPEIDWKTGEVKMTRCPEECGKKWKTGRQTKPGWKKARRKKGKEREEKTSNRKSKDDRKNNRRKEDEEENLIKLRATDEMIPQRFHKYLKVFKKKDSERMPIRKA